MDCKDCVASIIKTKVNCADILVIIVLLAIALWTVALITWVLTKVFNSADSKNDIESEDLLILGRFSTIIVSVLSLVVISVIIGLVLVIRFW